MQRVAIIGAGDLGGTIAHALARRDVVRAITLIDDTGRIAPGKALDIAQASPVERFATALAGTPDISNAAGAEVIVIADRAAGGEWQGEEALMLLPRLTQMAANAIIVCAGVSARDLVDRGVGELKMSRARLFGSAPEALRAGVRALVGLAVNGSPRDVSLTLLGVPPTHIVIPWEDATIGGFGLTRLMSEPLRRGLIAKAPALWPPGPHALAAAVVKAIESMAGRHRQMISCFVAPDDSAGMKHRTVALPVRLDATGIRDVVMPELSAFDRVALGNVMEK